MARRQHLTHAVAAVDLRLTDDDALRLEEHYVPHAPEGFWPGQRLPKLDSREHCLTVKRQS